MQFMKKENVQDEVRLEQSQMWMRVAVFYCYWPDRGSRVTAQEWAGWFLEGTNVFQCFICSV